MKRPRIAAHRERNLEKLKKSLRWYEKDLHKKLAEILDSNHRYSEDYAVQQRGDALKLYDRLICVDAIRVKADMELTGVGAHRITKPPEITIVRNDEPGGWVGTGENAKPIYFYKLVKSTTHF